MIKLALLGVIILGAVGGLLSFNSISLPVRAATFDLNGALSGTTGSDPAITVGADWFAGETAPPAFFWLGSGAVFNSEGPFTFTSTTPVTVDVTDDFCPGDRFRIYDFGVAIGDTTAVPVGVDCTEVGPAAAFVDPSFSHGSFALGSGAHSITLQIVNNPFGAGRGYIRVLPEGCQLNITRLSQGDTRWNPPAYTTPYDRSDKTIQDLGCALTSLSMALNFAGSSNDPGSLNQFMNQNNLYNGESVDFASTTKKISNGVLKFKRTVLDSRVDFETASQYLKDTLCKGFPVIVGVKTCLNPKTNKLEFPCHFVLVKGKQDNADGSTEFLIADPGYVTKTSLNDYNNKFVTRGFVADPPGDISELNLSVDDNTELLVIDGSGRRTGLDPLTGNILQEIPGADHFSDSLENDVTGEPPSETSHSVQISQPSEGVYRIILIGLTSGPFTLSIRAFSQDGTSQPSLVVQGVAEPGSTATVVIKFNSAPGSISRVFDACLQDDSNPGNFVLINTTTGEYSFFCNGSPVASGTGTLTTRGGIGSIEQNKGDRRLLIQWDTTAQGGKGAGTATLMKVGGKITCQITDRDMSNNTCTAPQTSAPERKPGKGRKPN